MDDVVYSSDQVVLSQGHCRILYCILVVVLFLNSQSTKHLQLFIEFHDGEGLLCFGIRTLSAYLNFVDVSEEFAMHGVLCWVALSVAPVRGVVRHEKAHSLFLKLEVQ